MLQRQAFTGAAAAIICDTVAETLLRIATRPDCEQQGRRIELSLTIGCNELSVQVKAPPSSYVWDEMPESTGTESSLRRPPADLTEHDVAANVSRSVRDGVLSFRWRCLPKVGE
ncbi:MAG: hypothetical protein HY000_26805 [Planctomycetes bacterium]|nr:hypothetical protein [Planctomycetota bacterium]